MFIESNNMFTKYFYNVKSTTNFIFSKFTLTHTIYIRRVGRGQGGVGLETPPRNFSEVLAKEEIKGKVEKKEKNYKKFPKHFVLYN